MTVRCDEESQRDGSWDQAVLLAALFIVDVSALPERFELAQGLHGGFFPMHPQGGDDGVDQTQRSRK